MSNIQALTERANHIYNSQKSLFDQICHEMNITKEEIIDGFVRYNSEVETLDNSAYEEKSIRIAMYMEYILEGSWHQERQNVLLDFINFYQPKTIIDIGFGAPMKYIKEYVLTHDCHLTLAEKFESAFDFAKIILSYWTSDYAKKIDFKSVDISEISFIGKYGVYILQDVIEHAPEPDKYLKNIVENCDSDALILLSLPIAPSIPCHFIYWLEEKDALEWVESCGLRILKKERVYTNKDVDWFAESLGDIYNLMLVATPIRKKE